jgi:hypothetical protein
MKAFQLRGADTLTVYTSNRDPIVVERGGIIETNDAKLIANLKRDIRFVEAPFEPTETRAARPHPIEQFTTEPPKKRGRPRLIRDEPGEIEQT